MLTPPPGLDRIAASFVQHSQVPSGNLTFGNKKPRSPRSLLSVLWRSLPASKVSDLRTCLLLTFQKMAKARNDTLLFVQVMLASGADIRVSQRLVRRINAFPLVDL